jgi:hypothetical protein
MQLEAAPVERDLVPCQEPDQAALLRDEAERSDEIGVEPQRHHAASLRLHVSNLTAKAPLPRLPLVHLIAGSSASLGYAAHVAIAVDPATRRTRRITLSGSLAEKGYVFGRILC